VNKYLRDYSKNSIGLSKESMDNYELNPKYCSKEDCGKKIPYEKRKNTHCNHSCSASHNNTLRDKYDRKSLTGIALENIRFGNRRKVLDNIIEYELNPKKCLNCQSELIYIHRDRKYCNKKCQTEYVRDNMDEFLKYKADTKFTFGLSDYPDNFDFDLIKEHGWYSPSNSINPNIGGVSRDHMLSVRDGFNKGVDPKLLAHPANCKLMIHSENISKHKNSSITEGELIQKIEQWRK